MYIRNTLGNMCHGIYTRNVNNYPLLGPCKRGAEWGFPLPPISLSISMGEPWGQHTLYTKSNFHSWFSSLTWFPKPNGTCTSFVVYARIICAYPLNFRVTICQCYRYLSNILAPEGSKDVQAGQPIAVTVYIASFHWTVHFYVWMNCLSITPLAFVHFLF